ncbi:MAG: cell division topological specificity factor MinE [Selenomonadaceae bacterium]|nr:cell division topological specificity factor MinE [Selenomonadaceae bacterium]MBP3722232.1 cell division topological specificity factor MinE [Selenomonadaceae bacterium]
MFDALRKLFGEKESSKDTARRRLQFVLVHDRASVQPEIMDKIREEIIGVISKYMDIERQNMEITLANGDKDNSVALVANIPVSRMKHGKR